MDELKRIPIVLGLALGLVVLLVGCASPDSGRNTAPTVYSFWPQFPAQPRVQFLKSYQYSDDVEPESSALEALIYGEGREVLPIAKPYGVEMTDGKIYVCDTQNAAVIVLDIPKQQTRVMGVGGSVRLQSPTDVAIADDGRIYVSDANRGAIFVFNREERHIQSIGYEGFRPTGIAVYGDEIYTCDFVSQQVQVLDRITGERTRALGEPGDQDGQFVRPLGIAVDAEGNVYTTDVIRCRIQKFSPEGRLLLAFGQIGDSVGSFVRPKHIAVDREGIIYVVDAAFANVQMFNQQGEILMFFGIAGRHPGSMKLPAGICVNDEGLDLYTGRIHNGFDPQRLIIVTNQFGINKVSAYALGGLREGVTPADIASSQAEMRPGVEERQPIDPLTGLPATDLEPGEEPEAQQPPDQGQPDTNTGNDGGQ